MKMHAMTSRRTRRPTWWIDTIRGEAWKRVRPAMRHDWLGTTHDFGVPGLPVNPLVPDAEHEQKDNEPSTTLDAHVLSTAKGQWRDAESAYGFGYAAHSRFGQQFPEWSESLARVLEAEWTASQENERHDWITVWRFVRRGYEYDEGARGRGRNDVDLALVHPHRDH
jgi:hypothetical protein